MMVLHSISGACEPLSSQCQNPGSNSPAAGRKLSVCKTSLGLMPSPPAGEVPSQIYRSFCGKSRHSTSELACLFDPVRRDRDHLYYNSKPLQIGSFGGIHPDSTALGVCVSRR
ncbi:hypothetical protein [Microseira wollei]|uniref:Uncharacterized protein n=1 Tax=Microseira wollei NIES-4236 TaxID=2530354 RepID=A0AAV3X858_9CYAN|nr:hypothetical protein [Microseira wollei]GET38343.1 hypothetical protein MiSe_30990 [Microseira wollei NIES-4236]